MHLSSDSCLISMHLSLVLCSLSHVFPVSFIPRLISFASHAVRYLICFMSRLRSFLNPQLAQTVSQILSRLQATSRNQSCITRIEIGDSRRNKMYIKRADILYSVELLNQSLMRSVTFNPFIDEIFALPFENRYAIYPLSELSGSRWEVHLRPHISHSLSTLDCSSAGVFVYHPLSCSSLTCVALVLVLVHTCRRTATPKSDATLRTCSA